jgi:hypothetical protein
VTGRRNGTTSVTFADSSTPVKTVTIPIVIQGSQNLVVTPNNISVTLGGTGNATISGGKAPYFVQTVLHPTIATAEILPATPTILTVNGVANGTTPVTITDSSTPAKTVTINITTGTNP